MTYSDLLKLSKDELQKKLVETEKELFELRFKKSLHQLDSTAKLRQLRHVTAQINTALRAQELSQAKSEAVANA